MNAKSVIELNIKLLYLGPNANGTCIHITVAFHIFDLLHLDLFVEINILNEKLLHIKMKSLNNMPCIIQNCNW